MAVLMISGPVLGNLVGHVPTFVQPGVGWIAEGRLNEDIIAGARIELDAQLSNAAGDVNLIGTESTEQTAWSIRIQEVTAIHRRLVQFLARRPYDPTAKGVLAQWGSISGTL